MCQVFPVFLERYGQLLSGERGQALWKGGCPFIFRASRGGNLSISYRSYDYSTVSAVASMKRMITEAISALVAVP